MSFFVLYHSSIVSVAGLRDPGRHFSVFQQELFAEGWEGKSWSQTFGILFKFENNRKFLDGTDLNI